MCRKRVRNRVHFSYGTFHFVGVQQTYVSRKTSPCSLTYSCTCWCSDSRTFHHSGTAVCRWLPREYHHMWLGKLWGTGPFISDLRCLSLPSLPSLPPPIRPPPPPSRHDAGWCAPGPRIIYWQGKFGIRYFSPWSSHTVLTRIATTCIPPILNYFVMFGDDAMYRTLLVQVYVSG